MIPSECLRSRYEEVARPLHQFRVANRQESSTLSTLRDTLLPKLISGEIRVPEAEEQVAEAMGGKA